MSMEELKVKREKFLLEEEQKKIEDSLVKRNDIEDGIKQLEKETREMYERIYIQTGSFETALRNYTFPGPINDKDFSILEESYPNITFQRRHTYDGPIVSFSFDPEYFFN